MKFFSEITKKMYDSVEELNNAEAAENAKKEEAKRAAELRAEREKEMRAEIETLRADCDEARHMLTEANKAYTAKITEYNKEFGTYITKKYVEKTCSPEDVMSWLKNWL